MTRPVNDPRFWAERLKRIGSEKPYRYRAVYECPIDHWQRINDAHAGLLDEHVLPGESVLDVGCGWGRLLNLMPMDWTGGYAGVDLSPDFVALARLEHPDREFYCCPVEAFVTPRRFDLAILVSVRGMILREQGEKQWETMRANIATMAGRALYLEYDPADPGMVEVLTPGSCTFTTPTSTAGPG